jgi:predicted nucleic acid-binding protein
MKIIVDTSVWSLALRRRRKPTPSPAAEELRSLIASHRVQMLGPIRQEILSGIRSEQQFDQLRKYLEAFRDLPILTEDHETAAQFFNVCRSQGIQGSNTDFLICAVAARNRFAIYTTDRDFERFARHLPIALHRPGEA